MNTGSNTGESAPRGFLSRLARDTRANALIIMTLALIPLAGMVGGGVDISRMYILKTRLQHACDAGVLAGRKAMGGGTWTHTSGYPGAKALEFFDANFKNGSFASYDRTRSFTENAGKVTGTATAKIPMTLMKIFKRADETITVTCDADMRLPNTDVMFVLDTTGSMQYLQPGDTVSKMDALKTAVKCFYEIVARLDTDAACTTGTPSGGTGNQVQIRFGFMPYATNVNVGKLLPTSYFADSWNYQTRQAQYTQQESVETGQNLVLNSYGANPNQSFPWNNYTQYSNVSSATCDANKPPKTSPGTPIGPEGAPYAQSSYRSGNTTFYEWRTLQRHSEYDFRAVYNSSTQFCQIQRRYQEFDLLREYRRGDTTVYTNVFSGWRYAQLPVNVGLLKSGTNWNDSFQWPIGSSAANRTIDWDGCIEERQTTRATDYDPIPSAAKDLDIDLVPAQGDATTLWGPALPQLIYPRRVTSSWSQLNRSATTTTTDYYNGIKEYYYYCPTEARKLQEWPSASLFDDYVDSMQPSGNTYHDIGLIWGARFASPTGIFAAENALTAEGGEIERHIIFMTDGDACAQYTDYAAYGFPWLDRRQTSDSVAPTGGCTFNSATLVEQVNRRTEGLCTAIKNKNITLWVIAFGDLETETETRLAACATPSRYFQATNAAQLQTTFKNIADQISQLRLTR